VSVREVRLLIEPESLGDTDADEKTMTHPAYDEPGVEDEPGNSKMYLVVSLFGEYSDADVRAEMTGNSECRPRRRDG
jgi:hypothetical protein